MPIKVPIEHRGPFRLQNPLRFRPSVNDPVHGGAFILLPFPGVFADFPQVDDLAHSLSYRPSNALRWRFDPAPLRGASPVPRRVIQRTDGKVTVFSSVSQDTVS